MRKTISQIKEGDFKILPDMTFNFTDRLISIGVQFDGNIYSCKATFEEVLSGYTPSQKLGLKDFFRKVKRIAINNGIQPDVNVLDSEIEDNF